MTYLKIFLTIVWRSTCHSAVPNSFVYVFISESVQDLGQPYGSVPGLGMATISPTISHGIKKFERRISFHFDADQSDDAKMKLKVLHYFPRLYRPHVLFTPPQILDSCNITEIPFRFFFSFRFIEEFTCTIIVFSKFRFKIAK